MRLMFLTGSLAYGGAERHAITLANRLAERGHECQLAWVKRDSAQLGRLHLASPGSAFCLDAARYLDLRAVRRLAGALARHRPEALVAANPYALMYASLARAAARVRVPLIVIYHSTRSPGLKEQAKLLAYRPCMWAAERAVFVCDHQRRYCTRRALLSRSNTVIHNGVDTDYFQDHCNASERQALRATLGYAPTDYVIGSAAALRPEKNHVQLVEATARLRGAGLGAKALLIGDGPTRAAVEGRARAMGVERDVTVTGFREDVRPYLAACDVVCVSSLTEALSLAAIEAMAMGKPLVHSEVGGARELVDPGSNGLLFPAGDTAALVQCLARLADPATRESMGRCARVRVETDFGEEGMIDRYERLLLSVCGAARAARTRPGPGTVSAAPRPVVFLLGPRRDALSGVSTHLNLLLGSPLAEEFALVHFEVGSEGRNETALGRAVRLIASPLRLGAALLSERAAIVHLNTALTGRAYWRDLAYAIVARLCGAHVLHQIHGGPVPQAFCRGSRAFAAFVRATLRLSDAIVAGYRSECEAFRDFLGSTPVFVFPNAVDHEAYATLSHSRPSQGPLRLLFMGRLIPEKGLAELFEALALTTSQCVETRLVVAGTGPAEARLRALAAAGGLAHVQFVGPVRGLDKMSLLEWADVFVLPTYHAEGLPYALLESMAAGLAVIATPVGAIGDLIEDGSNGLLVEPRSAPAIAAAIHRLASDRAALAKMSAAARATIVARYSIGRLAGDLCGVYRDLCARSASRRIARV